MFDKSTRFKQLYQLLLSLIVHTYMNTYIHTQVRLFKALRNDIISHFQNQSQRLPEPNDLKDSHAALPVASNEMANA